MPLCQPIYLVNICLGGYVRDPAIDPDSTEVYGVGAFLLAGSEVYRMLQQPIPPNPR